ncbi:MAG: GTP-binding protein [Lysobacterales bacterium]|jgi:GTP-binding protein
MIFVDKARIFVKAGNGGHGCESFHREKTWRFKRPDGGDGGRGGDVILEATRSIQTLLDFRFNQHFKGKPGGHASSNGKTGRNGESCTLRVPVGTIVRDLETGLLVKDLVEDGQTVVIARGGSGGLGNLSHKVTELWEPGEDIVVQLELKLIADVGLMGFPNAGKSTIISNISRVKSKIANYPFTTKSPILGFVKVEKDDYTEANFVVADLPGIIEGAHLGRGLGDKFLKHAERTKVIVHVVDMAGEEGRDPLDDYEKVCHELDEYSEILNVKKRLIVANKMDLPTAEENIKRFKEKYGDGILGVSGLEKQGLDTVIKAINDLLEEEAAEEAAKAAEDNCEVIDNKLINELPAEDNEESEGIEI